MRYWQVSLRRLSRAASKYDNDAGWHRSPAGPLMWYRVPDKKWLQRVQFEDDAEERFLLPMIEKLPSLPDLGHTKGFREETRFELDDGNIYQEILLDYDNDAEVKLSAMAKACDCALETA